MCLAQHDNIQQHPKTVRNNSKILQLKHLNSQKIPPPHPLFHLHKPDFLFALFELPDLPCPPGRWRRRPAAKPPPWRHGLRGPPSGGAFGLGIGGDRVSPKEKAAKVGEDFCLQKEFVEGKKVMALDDFF